MMKTPNLNEGKLTLNVDGIDVVFVPEKPFKETSKVIELDGNESVYEIGKNYLVRTVTMIQLGTLKRVTGQEFTLLSKV